MQAVDIVGLLVPITYFVMLAIEKWRPARVFPPRRGWAWLGVVFLLLIGTVSTMVPLLIDPAWLAAHRWMDGSGLGVVGGTVAGYVVLSALAYAVHRTLHKVPLLWRGIHQLHHSPQRVDMPGSVFFHPFEMVMQVLMQLFVTVVVLGLDPLAAALTGYVAAFYGMFQHWNVRTPTWLGYLIQRPESHCEHHRKGVHAHNYGDLPIWDLLLGTLRNPAGFSGECGFEAPADRRIGAMLALRDVNEPVYGRDSLGARRRDATPA
ncbi:MAG TPA: sterol desaturase family protein [Albitalea sp.]|nr:sterol desaturase family protein [Albitalea sp.]